jgi:hypothetical protein
MTARDRSTVAPATPELALLARTPPVLRREQLRYELLATVDSLYRRRADLVCEGFIADYVALRWLEWNGGSLRLTATGDRMCEQMRAAMN